jgi:hypothetical protein
MNYESYCEALAQVPEDAKWSSSFGYAGEGGFVEYWRTADGNKYAISNGPYDATSPFTWTLERED